MTVTDLLDDTLADFQSRIDPNLEPIPAELGNPLQQELDLQVPVDTNLLNLKHTNETIGYWFDRALAEVDKMLGEITTDPQGGPDDLGINIVMRNRFLDESGALTFTLDDSGLDFNPVLFDGHDRLTESKITLPRRQTRKQSRFPLMVICPV